MFMRMPRNAVLRTAVAAVLVVWLGCDDSGDRPASPTSPEAVETRFIRAVSSNPPCCGAETEIEDYPGFLSFPESAVCEGPMLVVLDLNVEYQFSTPDNICVDAVIRFQGKRNADTAEDLGRIAVLYRGDGIQRRTLRVEYLDDGFDRDRHTGITWAYCYSAEHEDDGYVEFYFKRCGSELYVLPAIRFRSDNGEITYSTADGNWARSEDS